MKCLCKFSKNRDVPIEKRLNSNFDGTRFDVVVGAVYEIFGQCFFAQQMKYLLDPEDTSRPNWYPAELFEIVDASVPLNWEFQFSPENFKNDLGAIWGYFDLVRDPQHFNGLVEREAYALSIFYQQKRGR